jgi:RimJ/RimL family protein N-acetyltransferase
MDAISLRSGRTVRVRPIRPDDAERLIQAHAGLSPETQYRRYLAVKPALSLKDARYLVRIDGRDHVALVATPLDDPDRIVAVARFVRLAEDPTAAEFSIVLGDGYQGERLGSALLQRLIEVARAAGVERFVAIVLADNVAAHALINRSVDVAPTWHRLGTVNEVEMDLAPAAALAA